MTAKKNYNIAVVGATGSVGSTILNILAERDFPVADIYAIASSASLGKEVSFGEKILKIIPFENFDFSKVDIAFFAAGSQVIQSYIQNKKSNRCVIIDKSSYFRLDKEVPLIVPEVNPRDIAKYNRKNLISSPNCCTIPMAVVLKPLDNEVKIKRVVASTYQSTSGAGKAGMDELYKQTKAKYTFNQQSPNIFPKEIAFNLFPQIGEFSSNGSTTEEEKITAELKKIIGEHLEVSVTCVRVPVFLGHAISLNIEFATNIEAAEVVEILQEADGVTVYDEERYTTPIEIVGEDTIHVSRVRNDSSRSNTVNLWLTVDNLRKGAALNSVQIAEELIRSYIS